jgi:hypothetical protein
MRRLAFRFQHDGFENVLPFLSPLTDAASEYDEMIVRTHMFRSMKLLRREASKLPVSRHRDEYIKHLHSYERCRQTAPSFMLHRDTSLPSPLLHALIVVAALLRNAPEGVELSDQDGSNVTLFARGLLVPSALYSPPNVAMEVQKHLDAASIVELVLRSWHALYPTCIESNGEVQPSLMVKRSLYNRSLRAQKSLVTEQLGRPASDLETYLARCYPHTRNGVVVNIDTKNTNVLVFRFASSSASCNETFTFPMALRKAELLHIEHTYTLQAITTVDGQDHISSYMCEGEKIWKLDQLVPREASDVMHQLSRGEIFEEKVKALYYQREPS